MLSLAALLALCPPAAVAETLALSSDAASDCPACATPTGGAQVINYVARLAPQDVSLEPQDDATPPSQGWDGYATQMIADEAAMTGVSIGVNTLIAANTVVASTATAELGAGAIAPLCSTGFACPAGLAIGAFSAGFLVGTGARALYIKLFGGDDNNLDSSINQLTWQRQNSTADFSPVPATGNLVVHYGEYYETYRQYFQTWAYAWTGAITSGQCQFGPRPVTNTIVRTGATTVRCSPPQPVQVYVRTPGMFFDHHAPLAPASSVNTSGATTVTAPAAPSRSAFGTSITNVLNDPGNHDFRLWLQHELDPRCSVDPTKSVVHVPTVLPGESTLDYETCLAHLGFSIANRTVAPWADDAARGDGGVLSVDKAGSDVPPGAIVTVALNPYPLPSAQPAPEDSDGDAADRPCDLGSGGTNEYESPGYDSFDVKTGSYTDLLDPSNFFTVDGYTTYLLYGEISNYNDWTGWGYRHIAAKHGWTTDDEAATRETLLQAPEPEESEESGAVDRWTYRAPTSMMYWGTTSSGSKVPCLRYVAVERGRLDSTQAPPQTGILTSYGKVGTNP